MRQRLNGAVCKMRLKMEVTIATNEFMWNVCVENAIVTLNSYQWSDVATHHFLTAQLAVLIVRNIQLIETSVIP